MASGQSTKGQTFKPTAEAAAPHTLRVPVQGPDGKPLNVEMAVVDLVRRVVCVVVVVVGGGGWRGNAAITPHTPATAPAPNAQPHHSTNKQPGSPEKLSAALAKDPKLLMDADLALICIAPSECV